MKWFGDDIATAVQTAKTKGVVMLVYIAGEDDLSEKMSGTYEDSTVTTACEQTGLVALKVEAKSQTCIQFSEYYPVVVVPCTYFIGNNGVPLEVTGGFVEPAEFVAKINTVVETHKAQLSAQPPAPAQVPVAPAQVALAPAPAPGPSSPQGPESQSSTESAARNAPTPEKVERVKDLMNKKREERSEKEADEEKKKEKERRQLGKEIGKLKDWKEDMKRKEIADELKKDREEEKKARERVREQIARDRLERAAKFKKASEETQQAQQQKQDAKAAQASAAAAQDAATRKQRAVLQFRLPDGSSFTQEFKSSETLQTAHDLVKERIGSTFGHFSLSTTFPRRTMTASDLPQTLLDLDLAPSAAIIVLPESRASSTAGGESGGGGGFIWALLTPFLALWNFLYTFLLGAPPQQPRVPPPQDSARPPSTSQPAQQTADDTQHQQQQQRSTRPKSSYGVRSRREGNIHRFSADDDDDEDMSTWNGNSTQQL